jgi:hypothetical protein
LRSRRIAARIEFLGVEPADDLTTTAGPQSIVRVFGELQMVGAEAGIDECIFAALRVIDRQLARP